MRTIHGLAACLATACALSVDKSGDGDGAPAAADDTEVLGVPGDGAPDDTSGGPGDTADDGWPSIDEAWAAALYDPRTVRRVELTVPPASEESLRAQPRTWAEADVAIDGETVARVGLRIKGSSSFRQWDDKPSLKIKTDVFVAGQELHGFERFTLNNMIEDPAQGREVVAYYLWNAAGMAASRCGWATVTVNGQPYGLYALLEPVDEAFLAQRYEMSGGTLWAAQDSANLTPTGIAHFELKLGEDTDTLGIAAEWLAGAEEPYYDWASEILDMDQFLGFLTWSAMTGFQDGYPYHLNDYFLYADPGDGARMDWMPWGMDESFDSGWIFQWGNRDTVGFDCMADADCQARFFAEVSGAMDVYASADPGALAEAAFAATEEAMLADPRRPYTPAEVEAARARLLGMLERWPDRIRVAMELP